MIYDVIVVGAGPGGSTTARQLARAGLKTLLLEKEKIPRYKPCGGGITRKVQRLLDFDFSRTIEDTITRLSVADRTERIRVESNVGWCVMRDKFDALLAEHAARAGAEVRDGAPVKSIAFDDTGLSVTTRNETLRARIVVGADGVNGIVRRAAKFPVHRRMAVAIEAEMEAPTAALEE